MTDGFQSRYFINSLARGLSVLTVLADAGEAVNLSFIADELKISMATAFRFMYTLEALGYVERDPESRTYQLTPKILSLGHNFFSSSNLWQTAHPYLLKACREHGETFNLAVLDDTQILYIDRVKTQKILDINLEIGSKLPAYCTSMGRVMLAALPTDDARERLLRSKREQLTATTIISLESLLDILDVVRRQGYAINNGEMAPELRSVAAPVRNGEGKVVAAANIAVNASQYDEERLFHYAVPAVVKVANIISLALGYQQPRSGT
ncbi:MAG: IclR family transcriptional regulator [Deltaproteobacteria bacterium]|nr:IclR family transcriptional regulator [Candidatus Anaeroferrophillus wilburensis]MBN2889012.1 IclR family transcriptional regulator [Deltaproteobacteria bacterium]